MSEIAETSYDYLQEAASPFNRIEDDDDDDDDDDLRNQSSSLYQYHDEDVGNQERALRGTTVGDRQEQQQSTTILNDSTELFYSAASAVSACLPVDGSSPEKQMVQSGDAPDFTTTDEADSRARVDDGLVPSQTPASRPAASAFADSTENWHNYYPLATPTAAAAAALSEAKSYVNGLLSPFSPILTKENLPREERAECMQFVSLQPCRKVSVVVRVLPVKDSGGDSDTGVAQQRCVFPHYKDEVAEVDASPRSPNENEEEATSTSSKRVILPRDMVVVNPAAFGKYIPSQVTMETAKLVAQVAHISSEDWARLYEFHHVMWPTSTFDTENDSTCPTSLNSKSESQYNTMDALSRAASQDALVEHQSSLLISLGQQASCIGVDDDPEHLGLWTMILNQCQALVETKGMIRLSMVEVLEDKPDSFRDLLFYSHRQHQQLHDEESDKNRDSTLEKPVITLRHPDMKGAILEGLTEVSIDDMPALLESLARRRRRRNKAVSASTAVIGILNYWDSAVSYELNRPFSSQIVCVELSSGSQTERGRPESITHRKSTVSLGQALRQLLLQASIISKGVQESPGKGPMSGVKTDFSQGGLSSTVPAVSFRESTLTKVLQRAMESSKICLLASISPLSEDYEQTITTLNYLRRLLVQPGKTVSSPFKPSNDATKGRGLSNTSFASTLSSKAATQADVLACSARKNNERLQELAQQKGMLQTLVADPRQRLAKVLNGSPPRTQKQPLFEIQSSYDKEEEGEFMSNGSSHNYQPTNYLHNVPALENDASALRHAEDFSASLRNEHDFATGDESRGDEMNGTVELHHQVYVNDELRHRPQDDFVCEGGTEWASEEEIEQALHDEIEGAIHYLYPEDNFSDEQEICLDDHSGSKEIMSPPFHSGIINDADGLGEQGTACYGNSSGSVSFEQCSGGSVPNQLLTSASIPPDGDHVEIGDYDDRNPDKSFETRVSEMETMDATPDEADDDVTLGLTPLRPDVALEDRGDGGNEILDHEELYFSNEDWQQQEGGEYDVSHQLEVTVSQTGTNTAIKSVEENTEAHENDADRAGNVYSANTQELAVNYSDEETEYELPQDPLPMNESMISQASPPVIIDERSAKNRIRLASPERQRSAFSSFSAPYASTNRASHTKEFVVLSREREHLNSTVQKLQRDLRETSEEHSKHLQRYEEEVQHLRARLDEAWDDRRQIEKLANEAISAQASHQDQVSMFTAERDELSLTVESLRDDVKKLSGTHEKQLSRYQQEIESAVNSQRALEKIADDAVAAHEAQIEENRVLLGERDTLQAKIDILQANVNASLMDNSTQAQRYQQEIRELHERMKEVLEGKRSVQMAADEARFALESQSENMRALVVERDLLTSTLTSLQANATKVSGEHNDHLRRFKGEIQQLHLKLDKALSEKLAVEKVTDEIRFSNDDLKRRLQCFEDEAASFRTTNTRLESLRREDQEIIAKLQTEVRKKESERLDVEHMRNELLRLKKSKDHVDDILANRQAEFIKSLKDRDSEISEGKRKHASLEGELASLRAELTLAQNQKTDALNQIKSYQEKALRLTSELHSKEDDAERLQSQCSHLESLRHEDQDTIRALNADLRERDSDKLAMDQLKQKLIRLHEDRDRLESLIKSREAEYVAFINERTNEVGAYINEMDSLKKKLEAAKIADQKHREEASTQLRAMQESESSMMQAVQQRDDIIQRLKMELSKTKEESASFRKREKSQTVKADREISHLRQRISTLEGDLSSAERERDDAASKSQNESRAHKIVLGELERALDEIKRQKAALDRLHEELASRQQESLQSEEKLFHLESTLRRFQAETKEKVGSILDRQRQSSSSIEKLKMENRVVLEDKQHLERLVEKLRKERDACFKSLQRGRTKLAHLSSISYLGGQDDDLFETPPERHHQDIHPAISGSVAAARSRWSMLPEIYVTDYSLGDRVERGLSLRAEEIAACVAISAKNSLQESHDETSQLRSQIHRLEEAKSAEVSALKAKVRTLEREWSHQNHKHSRQHCMEGKVPYSASMDSRYNINKRYASYPYLDPVE